MLREMFKVQTFRFCFSLQLQHGFFVPIIIIMDLQMVEDDYFYNTIQLTVQKQTILDRSTKLKGLLPNKKSPRRRHRSLYYQKAFRSFPFFGRSFTTQGSIH